MSVSGGLTVRFTPYFVRRAQTGGREIKDFLPRFCREVYGRWGEEAQQRVNCLFEKRLKSLRERLIFTALGEITTARYQTLEEFEARGLTLDSLVEASSVIAKRPAVPKDIEPLIRYLEGEEFKKEAAERTAGRETVKKRELAADLGQAQKVFPGYTIHKEAQVISFPEDRILAINVPPAMRDRITERLDEKTALQKGLDGSGRSIRDYLEAFGLNVLITKIEGSGISYSRLTMSGDLVISLAEKDDPIKALDDALVRIYFSEESVIRSYVRRENMPELLSDWHWINGHLEQYQAGALGNLISDLMRDHWVLNKTVLALIGKGIAQRLRGEWLQRFGEIDLETEEGVKEALRIVTAELSDKRSRWWQSGVGEAVSREVTGILTHIVGKKTKVLEAERRGPPPIVIVRRVYGEREPEGFNHKHPNSLVFHPFGGPVFVAWELPALGLADLGGRRLAQTITERGSVLGEGATIIAPLRSQRPQPKLPAKPVPPSSDGCTLCDPKKVVGPLVEYAELTPEQWLKKGPYAARLFLPLERHKLIRSFSGRNPFAFAADHRMVMHDAHADSIKDLTPAMMMALYHGADQAIMDILTHFQAEGIDQVTAGQNFGTAFFPYSAGATFMHPHVQVGAVHKNSFHQANALARRVLRYQEEKGIDFMEGYLQALRAAGLIFYEDECVVAFAPYAPIAKDQIQLMMKRKDAGNPVLASEQERDFRNFALALSILGLGKLEAPGNSGLYLPVGIQTYNTYYMGRRTTVDYPGQREVWTIVPRTSYFAFSELSRRYVVDRDPADTARYMQRTLNIMTLSCLLEGGREMEGKEVALLAEFATRKPGFGRLYQLTSASQFDQVRNSLHELLGIGQPEAV